MAEADRFETPTKLTDDTVMPDGFKEWLQKHVGVSLVREPSHDGDEYGLVTSDSILIFDAEGGLYKKYRVEGVDKAMPDQTPAATPPRRRSREAIEADLKRVREVSAAARAKAERLRAAKAS